MSFVQAIQSVFSKYADFNGRARRSEYWYFTLFNMIVSIALSGVGNIIVRLLPFVSAESHSGQFISNSLSSIWFVAIIVPVLALITRRLHDIGKSGWSYLMILVPIIGFIIVLVWFCKDSQNGPNQYGDSPKYPTQPNYYNPYNQQGGYIPFQQAPQQPYYQPPQQQGGYIPNPQQRDINYQQPVDSDANTPK